MNPTTEALINSLAGTLRGWRGTQAFAPARTQPVKLLQLYDMEASPYCRLVREVLTELDLDVMILPCPAGGTRFRPQAEKIGGKQQFPLLVDDNTGTVLYESAAIIEYLGRTYQRRVRTPKGLARHLAVGSSFLASAMLWRVGGVIGMKAHAAKAPALPLELYSFEASPYSKPVRARLCELELPYLLHNTGKAQWADMGPPAFRDKLFKAPKGTSRNRRWLEQHTGQVQVPYLIDPNTGTALYESGAIIDYLNRSYAV
jgi:glutathione S-transferase